MAQEDELSIFACETIAVSAPDIVLWLYIFKLQLLIQFDGASKWNKLSLKELVVLPVALFQQSFQDHIAFNWFLL